MDKYIALRNVTNWIENSSAEEFMSTFNELENDYLGETLGNFIDCSINETKTNKTIEYNILTTENFIFNVDDCENNIEKDVEKFSYIFNVDGTIILPMELIDSNQIKLIDKKQNWIGLYNNVDNEIYDYSLAA